MVPESYDLLLSPADLIEQLVCCHIKISTLHARVCAEREKDRPSRDAVFDMDGQIRRLAERRVLIRDAINDRLNQAIQRGGIVVSADVRTFKVEAP